MTSITRDTCPTGKVRYASERTAKDHRYMGSKGRRTLDVRWNPPQRSQKYARARPAEEKWRKGRRPYRRKRGNDG